MRSRTGRRRQTAKRTKQPAGRTKQTAKRMFIRGFLQSFFIVAILTAAGVLGYQITMKLWMIEPEETTVVEKPEPTVMPITLPSIDEVSKNLIFCYDDEANVISKLVLEVFHCEKKQLTYITIPMSTQFTMSDLLYKKLIAVQPSIPQMIRLSTMIRYLDEGVLFDYGVLMIEDMLEIEVSYYTVIPTELYQSMFEEKSIPDRISAAELVTEEGNTASPSDTRKTDGVEEVDAVPVVAEVFRRDYIKQLDEIDHAEEISIYIDELYKGIKSNLSIGEKLNYLESYAGTSLNSISFTQIAGNDRNSGFILDDSLARQQLLELGVDSR